MKDIVWDGKPISKPGMYRDIDIETYHGQVICAGPSVSSSGLRRCLEVNGGSPAHFYCEWSGNPSRVEAAEKTHFVIGRALHHLMLGQPFFAKSFIIRPEELPHYKTGELRAWHGNNTECKEWLAKTALSGKTVLTPDMIETIKGMSVELGKHPLVMQGILNGKIERSIVWQDKKTGLFVKVRPDAIPTDSGDVADLKSCNSVCWIDLMRSITDFAYHQQAALVRTAYREVLGMELIVFRFGVHREKTALLCSLRTTQARRSRSRREGKPPSA
jgi:hypothetical protein